MPVRITYRGMNNMLGLYEFVNAVGNYSILNQFTMSDTPLPSSAYSLMSSKGISVLHSESARLRLLTGPRRTHMHPISLSLLPGNPQSPS